MLRLQNMGEKNIITKHVPIYGISEANKKKKKTNLFPLFLKLQKLLTIGDTLSMVGSGKIFYQCFPFDYTNHFKKNNIIR